MFQVGIGKHTFAPRYLWRFIHEQGTCVCDDRTRGPYEEHTVIDNLQRKYKSTLPVMG